MVESPDKTRWPGIAAAPSARRAAIWLLVAVAAVACTFSGDTGPETGANSLQQPLSALHPEVAALLAMARPADVRSEPAGDWRIATRPTPSVGDHALKARLALLNRSRGGVELETARLANQPFVVRSLGRELRGVRVAATGQAGALDAGVVSYRGAWPNIDVSCFSRGTAVEELLFVRAPSSRAVYELELPVGHMVRAQSRAVAEIVDPNGVAWLRFRAPRAWSADGRVLQPKLSVTGNRIAVGVDSSVFPVAIDPQWESAAAMNSIREHSAATVLPSGRVLVIGGLAAPDYLTEAELYDPMTDTFSLTGAMRTTRIHFTATTLKSGEVLVAGGVSPSGNHSSAEIYDESTGNFRDVADLSDIRDHHTATLLDDGRVLVAGGEGAAPLSTTELFDPTTETFSAGGSMLQPRDDHTATRLPDGRVLMVGGGAQSFAELYDPTADAFSMTGSLSSNRDRHAAVLLRTGEVLVTGGRSGTMTWSSAEHYDPTSGQFRAAVGGMTSVRTQHTATLMPSGRVLISGGDDGGGALLSTDLYDPATDSFSAGPQMSVLRNHHYSVLLPTGKVMVAGGSYSNLVDLFDAAPVPEGSLSSASGLAEARIAPTATLLPSGRVLVAGGSKSGVPSATTELFDPVTNGFVAGPTMATPRSRHTATVLASGKVLLAGGSSAGGAVLSSVELYDPTNGTISPSGAMRSARAQHTAVLLPTGEVLIAGGFSSGGPASSAELYDPTTGTFSDTGNMTDFRVGHTATLLPNGLVLMTGNLFAEPCELYDRQANAGAGAFRISGTLVRTRSSHTATLLPTGKVLVTGGVDRVLTVSTSELYDPATEKFTPSAPLGVGRAFHAATVLTSGKVLITGGEGPSGAVAEVEIFDPIEGTTGAFTSAGQLAEPRSQHVAARLQDGRVLVAGGKATLELGSAELWDAQRIGDDAWRPVVASAPGQVVAGQPSTVTGSQLRGFTEGSDGTTSQSVSSNPVALWFPAGGGWGTVGRLTEWSDTGATWTPPATALAGPGWLHVVTNGVPSLGVPVVVATAPQGFACTVAGSCSTGYCVDGVCCESACEGPCVACNGALTTAGTDGVCSPVPAGSDPRDACNTEPVSTCGLSGECDGAGSCAYYAQGTECFQASCSGVVLTPAFTCDGAGSCDANPLVDCRPGTCADLGGLLQCVKTCSVDADCAPGSVCRTGLCRAPADLGTPCSSDEECISGACVDGVCCNTACDQLCEACVAVKTGSIDGVCGPVQAGTDPDDECDTEPVWTCGTDGFCDGVSGCQYYAQGTECAAVTCEQRLDEDVEFHRVCTADHTCSAPELTGCGAFACASTGRCTNTCTSNDHCHRLYRCSNSSVCVPRGKAICADDDTSLAADGTTSECSPFRCDESSGSCRETCDSRADCLLGFDCRANGECAEAFHAPDEPGCGCSLPGSRSRGNAAWLLLLGAGLLGSWRRLRA